MAALGRHGRLRAALPSRWAGAATCLWQADRSRPALGLAPASASRGRPPLAHAVYSLEVRHPVEVQAAQQEHLVQWLSKRWAARLKLPILADEGYELVGGRLLPGGGGRARAVHVPEPGGERITLYLGAIEVPAAGRGARRRSGTPARAASAGFYWVDQGFGYAFWGKVVGRRALTLAENVHRQL